MPLLAIPPKRLFSAKRMERVIENYLQTTADSIKVDFDTTTHTWKNRPKFLIRKGPGYREIYTVSDIYRYLSEGTKVRYATMSRNFRAKTRVRYIGSNAGRGGMIFVSKKHPRPGIKAREFPDALIHKHVYSKSNLARQMQRMIDAEVSANG